MDSSSGIIYEFADFRLIPSEGLLLRQGAPVSLSLKSFAILVTLVEHHGHLVTKSDLIESVWSDSFVEESAVSRCVWTIRNALGEESKNSRFIQTAARRGYRFIAPVKILNDPTHSELRSEHLSTGFRLPTIDQVIKSAASEPHEKLTDAVPAVGSDDHSPRVNTGTSERPFRVYPARAARLGRSAIFYIGAAATFMLATFGYVSFSGNTAPAKVAGNRIAVLPFRPVDVQQRDMFYDLGIAESLILKLSSDKRMSVRQLNAVRSYLDVAQDPVTVGKDQGVDFVLHSNYQIADGKIKVTSQLLDVSTGAVAENITTHNELGDRFVAQDSIADAIGNRLLRRFGLNPTEFSPDRGTKSEGAYREYQQGMYFYHQPSWRNRFDAKADEDFHRGLDRFVKAVELDPNYAQAWAGQALALRQRVWLDGVDAHETYSRSMQAAQKALEIDPQLSDAYTAICDNRLHYKYDFDGAEAACKKAIELDPNSSIAQSVYSFVAAAQDRPEEALRAIRTAIELDPNSDRNRRIYGVLLYYARRYDDAASQYLRLREIYPSEPVTCEWMTRILEAKGDKSGAFEWIIRKLELEGKPQEVVRYRASYQRSGWPGILRERLRSEKTRSLYAKAEWAAKLGDADSTFEFLESYLQQRGFLLIWIKVDPRFDAIRDDPRFHALVAKMDDA